MYKNQHLVPQVYLKGFSNKKIYHIKEEYSIYISEINSVFESKERGVKHRSFTKSYFYNFDKEKKEPIVEKNLSKIENEYKRILKNLMTNNITLEDVLYISNFTLLQYQRTENFIDNFQGSMDEVAKIYDMFDNGSRAKEEMENIALKMLKDFKIENMYKSNIIHEQGIHFIVNDTGIPFITSDKPVVHSINHIDQVKSIFNDSNIKYNDKYLPSDKSVFFFFPLNEKFALISTKFLISQSNIIQYITVNNKSDTILRLNIMSYGNAHKAIYSSMKNPFENFEKIIESINNQYKDIGYWAHIYTDKNRYILELENYKYGLNNMILYLKSDNSVKQIFNDFQLKEIIIYLNEEEMSHIKNIKLDTYDNKLRILKIKSEVQLGTEF
jgi:hypothetical protein